jgi:hypothetical protein
VPETAENLITVRACAGAVAVRDEDPEAVAGGTADAARTPIRTLALMIRGSVLVRSRLPLSVMAKLSPLVLRLVLGQPYYWVVRVPPKSMTGYAGGPRYEDKPRYPYAEFGTDYDTARPAYQETEKRA